MVRDHYDHFDGSRWHQREYRDRWVNLAHNFNGGLRERYTINLERPVSYERLRIEATKDAPMIQKVILEFGDGARQEYEVNDRLTLGAGAVFRVDGRPIARVFIIGDTRYAGEYAMYGLR